MTMDPIQQDLSVVIEHTGNRASSHTTFQESVAPFSKLSQTSMDNSSPIRSDKEADLRSPSRPRSINTGQDTLESHAGKTTPDTPSFPHSGKGSLSSSRVVFSGTHLEGEVEEQARSNFFRSSPSPSSPAPRKKATGYRKVGKEGTCKMHKFSLYETASRYYLVGGDIVDNKFRVLKIDRTAESGSLSIAEEEIVYTKEEMNQLLNAVDDGNKSSGGLKLKCTYWGLLGFIRFTGAYYMLVITKRSQVALIGGHYIYQVDGTELIPLTSSSSFRSKSDHDSEEVRFVGILNNLDLSRSFYFSYSYNVTRTLQQNIIHEREALQNDRATMMHPYHNAMFVWNHYFLQPVLETLKSPYDWCLPIVHGFINQASESTP